jgi:hypothetical protein
MKKNERFVQHKDFTAIQSLYEIVCRPGKPAIEQLHQALCYHLHSPKLR